MQRVSLPYAGIDGLSNLDVEIKTKLILVAFSRERAETLARNITEAFENTGKSFDDYSSSNSFDFQNPSKVSHSPPILFPKMLIFRSLIVSPRHRHRHGPITYLSKFE